MTRTPSFSQMLRAGSTRDELMQRFALSEEQYERVVLCVERIRSEQGEQEWKKEKAYGEHHEEQEAIK